MVRATSCVLSPSSARNTTTNAVATSPIGTVASPGNRSRSDPDPPPMRRSLALAAVVLLLAACGGDDDINDSGAAGGCHDASDGRVTLVAHDLKWDTDCLKAPAGSLTI